MYANLMACSRERIIHNQATLDLHRHKVFQKDLVGGLVEDFPQRRVEMWRPLTRILSCICNDIMNLVSG